MAQMTNDALNTKTRAADTVDDALAVVAKSLHEASENALELSEEASLALSNAAAEVVRVAEDLRRHSVEATKELARKATHEMQEHPIASVAAALAALGALVGVIVASRAGGKAL